MYGLTSLGERNRMMPKLFKISMLKNYFQNKLSKKASILILTDHWLI